MWASPLLPAAPLRPRPRGRRQRTFLRHGSPLRPASCADTHASVRRGKTVERNLNTNGHGMKRRMCTNGLHRWRPRKFVLLLQQTMEVLSSEYARAVKIEEKQRKERGDSREGIDGRGTKGQKTLYCQGTCFPDFDPTRMFSTVSAPFQLLCCRTLA